MVDVAIGQLAEAAAQTAEKAAVESEQARVEEVKAAGETAVAVAKEETRQTEIIARSQVEAAKETMLTEERMREIALQCMKEHGMLELMDTLDECGRHMMAAEATGGVATNPNLEATKPDGTTPAESAPATSSEAKPDSKSGTEAVVVVEAPLPVSAQTVTQEQKPRGFLGTLIFGRNR